MVESVRNNPITEMGGIDILENGKDRKLDEKGLKEFYECVEQAQVFVFETPIKSNYEQWLKEITEAVEERKAGGPDRLLPGLDSAPFPIFSLECLNGPLCTPDEKLLTKPIVAILAKEVAPLEFKFYTLMSFTDQGGKPVYWVTFTQVPGRLAELYVQSISTSVVGHESVKERIKVGRGADRRTHTIRKIIRIVPKAEVSHARPIASREIDWSHRWLVRGHWRRRPGLGKDRAGTYCINGFTWVIEHERGPEDAPLISDKVRVVSSPPINQLP